MLGYEGLDGFQHLFLEDSFVLEICAMPSVVSFGVEAVLLEGHDRYSSPIEGEQHAYGRVRIVFRAVTDLRWSAQGRRAAVDATGEEDYGGFDEFSGSSGSWTVCGDWGEMNMTTVEPPSVEPWG